MKLKALLEGYAWERKPGKGLPTLAEVEAQHRKNLSEEDDLTNQSLTALSTVCQKCKSDLETAFNQTTFVDDKKDEARNTMRDYSMVLMAAICNYIEDIRLMHEQHPEVSMDLVVIDNAKKILVDESLSKMIF